ncbi:MAG: ArdC family protein [Acidobacteria bacterium]|nr:ArdC family protein [Acidobacteriota bacterium]
MGKLQEKANEYHEQFAARIIAALKEGTAPWQKPWKPSPVARRSPGWRRANGTPRHAVHSTRSLLTGRGSAAVAWSWST